MPEEPKTITSSTSTTKRSKPDFMNMTMSDMMHYAQAESDRMMGKVERGIKTLKRALMGLFALNIAVLIAVLVG